MRATCRYARVHTKVNSSIRGNWHQWCEMAAASYVNNINQVLKSLCISNKSERVMPSHLSTYLREQIVALWGEGKKVSKILMILESKGTKGRRTLHATVWRWAFRWRTNRGLRDQHRSGQRSKITTEMAAFVEAKLQE